MSLVGLACRADRDSKIERPGNRPLLFAFNDYNTG